jgi:hypothetical protein
MNPRIDMTVPLEIEITEDEILADLLYPAPLPPQMADGRAGAERDAGQHAGRRNGRPGRGGALVRRRGRAAV